MLYGSSRTGRARTAGGRSQLVYLVIAKDARDREARERRQQARPEHLAALEPLVEAGTVRLAGAMLDDDDKPVGSLLLVEADDVESVRELLRNDAYTRNRVWTSFEIHPFRQVFGPRAEERSRRGGATGETA